MGWNVFFPKRFIKLAATLRRSCCMDIETRGIICSRSCSSAAGEHPHQLCCGSWCVVSSDYTSHTLTLRVTSRLTRGPTEPHLGFPWSWRRRSTSS